jgi:hypothetical protein
VITESLTVNGDVNITGNILGNSIDTTTATTLTLGPNIATKVELADTGITTEIKGDLNVLEESDFTKSIISKNENITQLAINNKATTQEQEDSQVWTSRTAAGDDDTWQDITWSPELSIFCAVGSSGDDLVMTSPDGVTWTSRTAAGDDDDWHGISWSPELSIFCVVGSNGDRVMTSPDGITWTIRTAAGDDDIWRSIVWSPELSIFCVVALSGDKVMTSPDGITWTIRTAAGDDDSWLSITWAPELSLFCAVGYGSGDHIMTSPDGITWTSRSGTGDNDLWNSITWSAELKLFCAVGLGGDTIMTSPDGITWTSRSSSNEWSGVIWSPQLSLFCTVGAGGTNRISTSPDGITWTDRIVIGNDDLFSDISWSPELGIFCAVSTFNDRVATSTPVLPASKNTIIGYFDGIDFNYSYGLKTGGNLDTTTATTLTLGPSEATKVEIADTGITTEIQGPLIVKEDIVSDEIDTETATTMLIGKSTATKIELADSLITTEVQGPLVAKEDIVSNEIDTETATTMLIGKSTATKIELADSLIDTDILGTTSCQEKLTVYDTTDTHTNQIALPYEGAVNIRGGMSVNKSIRVDKVMMCRSTDNAVKTNYGGATSLDVDGSITCDGNLLVKHNQYLACNDIQNYAFNDLEINAGVEDLNLTADTVNITGDVTITGDVVSEVTITDDTDVKITSGEAFNVTQSDGTKVFKVDTTNKIIYCENQIDTVIGSTLALGPTNATKVEIADTLITTEIQGPLTVDEATVLDKGLTVNAGNTLIHYTSGEALRVRNATTNAVIFQVDTTNGYVYFPNIKTSSGGPAGTIWSDSGTLKIN